MGNEFARMNKPREIEGVLDTWLIRPLGYLLVLLLKNTSITPNMVSVASVAAAIGAAGCYFHRSLEGALGGLFFMLLTSALDSADGQLARATGRGSELGRTIDGVCDNVSFLAIYLSIVISYAVAGGAWSWALAVGVLAGLSHSAQSAVTDFHRQLYVHLALGGEAPRGERPEVMRARLVEARRLGAGPLERLLYHLHLRYVVQQRFLLATGDKLERAAGELAAQSAHHPTELARLYRAANRLRVRWWWLGAANVHKVGIVLSAFLPVLIEEGPIHELGMVLYFPFEIVLNLPVLWLVLTQRTIDRRLLAAIHVPAPEIAAVASASR